MNCMRGTVRKALAILMAMVVLVCTVDIHVYATEGAEESVDEVTESVIGTGDGEDAENAVYEGEDYRVTFTLIGSWEGGYNANIKIENTGESTIENWCLGFEWENTISSVWNAELQEQAEGRCVIKNAGWNQDILAGGSVEFGLSGNEDFLGYPTSYQIIGGVDEADTDSYSVDYCVTGDWGSGFTGTITVTNNTEETIEDWVLEFDFDNEITSIWDGEITAHEGNHYIVRNARYNSSIEPRKNVCIGIMGSGNGNEIPFNIQLVYSTFASLDNKNTDLESDGVLDYLEDYFGTDKSKADTDGDGLSDYIEIFIVGLNPTVVDTDNNKVDDGNEDFDQDGLSNLYELEIGTDISKDDTDSDGISEFDEINIFYSNPLEYDTDSDYVSDGKELQLGTNPCIYNSNFEVFMSANSEDTVMVSVEIVLQGEQVESLSVEKYENEFYFPTNMPGYLGGAYDFSVEGSFDTATIMFEFDESLLSDESFDPIVYYFNEEKQLLEELPTIITGNTACAEVTHFSKYILLDRKIYNNTFEWQDVWSATGYSGVEVVLVIDDSSSMYSTDYTNERLIVAKSLIDKLPNNSKVGIVKFSDKPYKITSKVISDKELAKSYLTTKYFWSYGNTYMYSGINEAFSVFESNDNTMKMMVVLSDGVASDIGRHSTVISTANSKGVNIYTVGLGSGASGYFTKYMKPLAENTGGVFYLAANAEQLVDVYNDINNKIDIETDSDGDGIADYYEDNMNMFNGITIALDKNNPDSDGDGIEDGGEVAELNYRYSDDGKQVIVTGRLLSNPLEKDSDYDGRVDSIDAAPLNNHFVGVLSTQFADSNVAFNMDYRWFFVDNSIYCERLSKTSSLFASAMYDTNYLSISDSRNIDSTKGETMSEVMNYFGLNNTKTIKLNDIYSDIHVSEVGLGYRMVSYNDTVKNVVAVVIRGTNSTIEEWSSNFEIGNLSEFGSQSDWVNVDNHAGFDIAANRIMDLVTQYISDNKLDESECVYWITGHSRGAAIANLIGAYYEDEQKVAYTYTYAAPNTTMNLNASSYDTIFNIVNVDDFVPCLPMENWGYTRYGRTASVSIDANYEKEWEKLTGIRDYDPDTFGMQDTVKTLAEIILAGDAREEVYKYTCDCHGDDSLDIITVTNYGTSKTSRDNAIGKIPINAVQYCAITKYDGWGPVGWNFDNCQTPAYFMQLLAAVMAKEIKDTEFVVDMNVAERYESAKTAVIKSSLGGLKHPHYTESYYILAENVKKGAYK